MSSPVTIENDHFRLHVWPTLGGHVSSIVDKFDGYELLLTSPGGPPTSPQYDQPFTQPGWAECFPAVAGGPYPGAPYDGIAIPDHGEVWGLPTTAVPAMHGITTVWHGLRFGYRFVRKLHLQGPAIVAEYTLVNLAPFEFRFVWALHALLSRREPVRWVTGDISWDRVDPDVTEPHRLPTHQSGKRFANEPITAPFEIQYPTRYRSLSIEYAAPAGPAAYWGLWIDNTAVAAEPTFAIEPTTGRTDSLADAVADGSAGRVGPTGTCKWIVRLTAANLLLA